jgi:hypothetical protein
MIIAVAIAAAAAAALPAGQTAVRTHGGFIVFAEPPAGRRFEACESMPPATVFSYPAVTLPHEGIFPREPGCPPIAIVETCAAGFAPAEKYAVLTYARIDRGAACYMACTITTRCCRLNHVG